LDLNSCIDIIETLNSIDGLSPEQRTAIRNLRSATASGYNNSPQRQFQRRDATFFGLLAKGAAASMSKELVECFHEVEDNKADTDQQCNVTAVLANYGGEIFDNVFSIAPHSKKKENGGIDSRDSEHTSASFNSMSSHPSLTSLKDFDVSDTDRPVDSRRRDGAVGIDPLKCSSSIADLFRESDNSFGLKVYCPPEWNALTKEARAELTSLLSWESLSQWDFNILNVADLSREMLHSASTKDFTEVTEGQFCPLLLVGWAILCAPLAQQAMEGSLGDNAERETNSTSNGRKSSPYHFNESLNIQPERVCNFLREIERRYQSKLPYHNNIHAADVTQTLHCLLQLLGEDKLSSIYDPVKIFSVLLAATFHDVGHSGFNNLFQKNARTRLAIRYNDASILENMHSYVGHSLLMGEEKRDEWDVFKEWNGQDIEVARNVMMSSVLGTDMSNHFEAVGELAGMLEKVQVQAQANDIERRNSSTISAMPRENERRPVLSILAQVLDKEDGPLKKECTHLANFILKFLMHASDISNPTKKLNLAIYWADMALAEFFAQGTGVEVFICLSVFCPYSRQSEFCLIHFPTIHR